jgi:hypothetical protein
MSLVEEIKRYLPNDVVAKLSSMLGLGEAQTKTAVGAAVPAMLAGASQMAQSTGGADKLASALKNIDLSALNNPMQALSGGSGLGDIGGKLLGNLFGGSVLGGLGDVIGKFSGLGGGASKLLGMIAPFVLGGLAKKWLGGGGTTQGLTNLLNSEKANIQAAMPSGFSLGNVFSGASASMPSGPSMPKMPDAPAGGGLLKILLPILLLLGLLAAIYYIFFNKTTTPSSSPPTTSATQPKQTPVEIKLPGLDALTGDAKTVGEDLTSMFGGLTETLGGVKDAATADAALPKIAEMTTKLGGIKSMFDKLPEVGKKGIVEIIKGKLGGLKELVTKVLMIPGLGEKMKPAQALFDSLEAFTK